MITVKPRGGLDNRMRVLYTVLALNESLNYPIKIIWDCSYELNCPFDELFTYPDYFSVKNIKQNVFTRTKEYFQRHFDFSVLQKLRYDVVICDRDAKQLQKDNSDLVEQLKNSTVYIETCYNFYLRERKVEFLNRRKTFSAKQRRFINRSIHLPMASMFGVPTTWCPGNIVLHPHLKT